MTDQSHRIRSGGVHVFYLFDVANAIDLKALKNQLGPEARSARLDDKAAGRSPVGYLSAPLQCDGALLGVPNLEGFTVRIKFYDYGVISVLLSRPFSGSWAELLLLGQTLIENDELERKAAAVCTRITEQIPPALTGLRQSFLSEDYLVFAVTEHEPAMSAEALVNQHGEDIAQLLRGERLALSRQEREEVLRHALSYLQDDLVLPAWNAAFVFDKEPAVLAAMEIFELANSQLLEFRYHDDLLDGEMMRLYADLDTPRWSDRWAGRRHARAARRVQALVIDVNELTDRMENTVKFVGDIYSARLFDLVAARLGLDRWKRNVGDKLETLDDIQRFAVEQSGISHANTLELGILLICAIDLWFLILGLMK